MQIDEAEVTINGRRLTDAQVMALRTACTIYHDEMASNPDALGTNDQGRRMAALYRDRLGEVLRIIIDR